MNIVEMGEELYRRTGDYPRALVFEEREYSSGELRRMSLRLAAALRELGVGVGDRVAVMTPNCPEVGATYAACWRIGAVTVPILFLLAPSEVEHILRDSEPRVVVTGPEVLPAVQAVIARLEAPPLVVVIGDTAADGARSLDGLVEGSRELSDITQLGSGDLAAILYTGGTTGRPKGVMLSHGGMVAVTDSVLEAGSVEEGKVALATLPLAHAYGILTQLIGMRVPGNAVMMRWFQPEEALQLIDQHRIQVFAAVPTMLVYLLNLPNLDQYDGRSLERVSSGAAPCPVELIAAFEKRFECQIFEGYGLTESTVVCCGQRPDLPRVPGSVGVPIPGVEVSILNDEHREMATGELGEICVRGPNVMLGYYRMPDLTAVTVRSGWLHTGDVGRKDAEGNVYVVERKKDLIIRGGLNIYPRDVEEVLFEHPAVAEAAVVGRPDSQYGEEVVAFVVPRPGAHPTEEEIVEFARRTLAKYKTPKQVIFVDTLPKTGVGKVLRRELRARAAEVAV